MSIKIKKIAGGWGGRKEREVDSDYNYPDVDNLQSIKSAALQRCTYAKSLGWQKLVFITR